jgi:zinc protease
LIIQNGVKAQDLERAKKSAIAAAIYAKEDLKTLANYYGVSFVLGLGTGYVENWERDIGAVTAQQVQEAAAYVFDKNKSVTGYLLVAGEAGHAK